MSKATKAILTLVYPKVTKQFNERGYNQYLSKFIEDRHNQLYDIAPCDRIFFRDSDYQEYFAKTNVNEEEVKAGIKETFYWHISAFNPRAAKDPLTIAQLCYIRQLLTKNAKEKVIELAAIFLAFSGKFYPSIHYASYPKTPPNQYRHIMEYVVNQMLTEKYELKKQGTVIGAIRISVWNWINAYKGRFRSFSDDDIAYIIQQLHNRVKSFTKGIATLYYDAYQHKDQYMAYNQESLKEDDYRMSDNDSLLAERIVQKTMERINTKGVDYKSCLSCSDYNVRVNEIKGIVETIITNPDEQITIRELLGIIVSNYFTYVNKDINSIEFISYSTTPKSNSKDVNYLRGKEIIETWLNEKSLAYRKRSKRPETKASYERAIHSYFCLQIYYANK